MRRVKKIYYNGLQLDSKPELRFLLTIEDTHCFIYHPFRTYAARDIDGVKVVDRHTKSYAPDFLIRDIRGFDPEVIEVKGKSDKDRAKRTRLIYDFIEDKETNVNYEFSWVNMNDVELSEEKEQKFMSIIDRQGMEKKLYYQVKNWIKPGLPLINMHKMDDRAYVRFVRKLDESHL